MSARNETIALIARQIAMHNGQNFFALDDKQCTALGVLAGNIMATVERKMTARDSGIRDYLKRIGWL